MLNTCEVRIELILIIKGKVNFDNFIGSGRCRPSFQINNYVDGVTLYNPYRPFPGSGLKAVTSAMRMLIVFDTMAPCTSFRNE